MKWYDGMLTGALLMAIMLNGIDDAEATHLTHFMTNSGTGMTKQNCRTL